MARQYFRRPVLDNAYSVKVLDYDPNAKTKSGKVVEAYKIRRYLGYTGSIPPCAVYSRPYWVPADRITDEATR